MDIRPDLISISPYISRLLGIADEFHRNDNDWSHLKNKEDFRFIVRIPEHDRYKIDNLYSTGRDIAIFMASELRAVNYDYAKFPTLTSIIERFNDTWVYNNNPTISATAESICEKYDVNLWSVGQMCYLYTQQIQLLNSIKQTLNILRTTDLYKIENGIPIMNNTTPNVVVTNSANSNININADNNNSTISINTDIPELFATIKEHISKQNLQPDTEELILNKIDALSESYKQGTYTAAYREFMQDLSAHITVLTPFLAGLASLIP